MLKAGEPFVAPDMHTGVDQEYRVLASDTAFIENSWFIFAKLPYQWAGAGTMRRHGDGGLNASNLGNIPGGMIMDYNYLLDDGSATMLRNITAFDPDITLPRTSGWGGRLAILPNPLK
jgi:hypothetical protein